MDEDQPPTPRLFDLPPQQEASTRETVVSPRAHDDPRLRPLWTESKARLIERYLYFFVQVTKHGMYIDGFAGPQTPENPDSWAAKLVLETEPKWMRGFHLCDKSPAQVRLLEELRSKHPDRDVHVYQGDFNAVVDRVLDPDVVPPNAATFSLLDQRTFECEWATVEKIARYEKTKYKIEMFYFLATGWLDRSLAGVGEEKVTRWWGRDDWRELIDLVPLEQARWVAQRFRDDLGYGYALPLAIHESGKKQGRVMYYMIHASDHPRAHELMLDAYRTVVMPKGAPLQPLPLALPLADVEQASRPMSDDQGSDRPPSTSGRPIA